MQTELDNQARQTPEKSGFHRVIGRYSGPESGPLLVCLGGIHGNEPAGVKALERVLDTLQSERPAFRGDIVGLAGNLGALEHRVRYLDSDLNRAWSEDILDLIAGDPGIEEQLGREAGELAELEGILERMFQERRGEGFFIDLHTSSARGVPFALISDTLRNRKFAKIFPSPVILGLEEQVKGSILEFLSIMGWVTIGFEGGRHDLPTSVDHHEAAVWLALASCGCLNPGFHRVSWALDVLRKVSQGYPSLVEVRHRHAITESDRFRMEPGFENFQKVRKGELLAHDCRGEVRAPRDCRVMLPLYQGMGEDGFFLGRDVNPLWLKISALMRHMRFQAILRFLPGVKRHPQLRDGYLVDPKIARWLVVEIFHLLGFRQRESEQGQLVLTRRPFDLHAPPRP